MARYDSVTAEMAVADQVIDREPRQWASTEQTHSLAFPRPPNDRRMRCTGIVGGEFERVGAKVISASEPNGGTLCLRFMFLFEFANLVPRRFQRSQRFGACPRIEVTAVDGDVEIGCSRGPTMRDGQDREDCPRGRERVFGHGAEVRLVDCW